MTIFRRFKKFLNAYYAQKNYLDCSIPSFEMCAFVEALFPTPMLRILLDHYFLMKRCVSTTVVYSVDLLCDLFYLCQEKNHTKLQITCSQVTIEATGGR